MNKEEFLAQLKTALGGNIASNLVQENLDYYNQYIAEEVRKGKSEQEVLAMLGDPWILARTIIDANDGTDRETVYEAGGNVYEKESYGYEEQKHDARGSILDFLGMDTWWKKLLAVLLVVMVVMLVVSIITGLVRLLLPLLVPLLIIAVIVRLIGGRSS